MGHNDVPSPSNCTPSNGNTLPSLYKRSLLTEYWSKPVSQLNVVDLKTAALDLGAPVGRTFMMAAGHDGAATNALHVVGNLTIASRHCRRFQNRLRGNWPEQSS